MTNSRSSDARIRIRMLTTVRPDLIFLAKPGTILRDGEIYEATTNPNAAISGICENGEHLGVKPGEFAFVEAPDWVLKIHKAIQLPKCEEQECEPPFGGKDDCEFYCHGACTANRSEN